MTKGIVLLLLYVNDMVLIGSDHASIQRLKQHLQVSFHMKDLDNLHYFIGEVSYSRKESSYIDRNTLMIFYKRLERQHTSLQVHY